MNAFDGNVEDKEALCVAQVTTEVPGGVTGEYQRRRRKKQRAAASAALPNVDVDNNENSPRNNHRGAALLLQGQKQQPREIGGVVDLCHSSDEDDQKPPARRKKKRPRNSTAATGAAAQAHRAVALLDSDDDEVVYVRPAEATTLPPPPPPLAAAAAAAAASRTHRDAATSGGEEGEAASLALARRLQEEADAEASLHLAERSDLDVDPDELRQRRRQLLRQDEEEARRLQSIFGRETRDAAAAAEQEARADEAEARRLQSLLEAEGVERARRAEEEARRAMSSSVTGKALLFVRAVLDLSSTWAAASTAGGAEGTAVAAVAAAAAAAASVSPVAKDDMVYLAEATLTLQEQFRLEGKPTAVDLGIHYTRSENMARIRSDGLLTKADRDSRAITGVNYNGSAYGDGVYTADDLVSSSSYGDIGLIVARLRGNPTVDSQDCHGASWVVLRRSAQCLALIQFRNPAATLTATATSIVTSAAFRHEIASYQDALQKVIDEYFNGGQQVRSGSYAKTVASHPVSVPPPPPILPLALTARIRGRHKRRRPQLAVASALPAPLPPLSNAALMSMATGISGAHSRVPIRPSSRIHHLTSQLSAPAMPSTNEIIQYHAPQSLSVGREEDLFTACRSPTQRGKCAICLDDMKRREWFASLVVCSHEFHRSCVREHFLRSSKTCPTCRKAVGRPQGKMPSGTMSISYTTGQTCSGYGMAGTIVIGYSIRAGTQMPYHDNPGVFHGSANRTAFLPNNAEGRKLLKRLKHAFRCGLTFTVGTSMTTGTPNSVTWASIHHKTSLAGGPQCHGFPDPNFFVNCNGELDSAGVPSAEML